MNFVSRTFRLNKDCVQTTYCTQLKRGSNERLDTCCRYNKKNDENQCIFDRFIAKKLLLLNTTVRSAKKYEKIREIIFESAGLISSAVSKN